MARKAKVTQVCVFVKTLRKGYEGGRGTLNTVLRDPNLARNPHSSIFYPLSCAIMGMLYFMQRF